MPLRTRGRGRRHAVQACANQSLRQATSELVQSLCSHHRTPWGDGFSRLCACISILAVTLACFWVYGLILHREPAYASLSPRAHALEYRGERPTTPAAVAPDMNSDAVRHANADVPAELQTLEQKPEPNKAKHAAVPHRKKKATVIARRRRRCRRCRPMPGVLGQTTCRLATTRAANTASNLSGKSGWRPIGWRKRGQIHRTGVRRPAQNSPAFHVRFTESGHRTGGV